MNFRKAKKAEASHIMNIIKQAQTYLKEQKINQWQDGYPNIEVINKDIDSENNYVLLKEEKIIASAVVSLEEESSYANIYEGKWLTTNSKYVVIHRLAVDNNYKGLGISSKIIKNIEELSLKKGINSIKIDTHEDNMSMQKLLKKNEFKYCGVIYLQDGSKRLAFEKILN